MSSLIRTAIRTAATDEGTSATTIFFIVLILLLIWASLAYLRPRDSPWMAGILARFGLQPAGTALVVSIGRGELPKGTFSVRVTIGNEEFSTRRSEDGEFEQQFLVIVPQHALEASFALVELHDGKSITAATTQVAVSDLLRAMGSQLSIEFVKQKGKDIVIGTLQVTARIPPSERTSLLADFDDDAMQIKAAIVSAPKKQSPEKVLEELIEGPITCLGNSVTYCRVEATKNKETKKAKYWCFYDAVPDTESPQEPHFKIPIAQILSCKHTSPEAFQIVSRHGNKDETLFLQVAKDARVWAESVKALKSRYNKTEAAQRKKTWFGYSAQERHQEWEGYSKRQSQSLTGKDIPAFDPSVPQPAA